MAQRAEAKYTIRAKDKTGSAMRSVSSNLKGVATAMVATFGARAIASTVTNTAKEMDELAKTSRRLGMSAKDLDAWGYVAELNGASVDTMTKSIKKLSTSMYDAGLGLKTYTDIFDDLGVEYQDQEGNLRSTNDVLFDTADALSQMENQAKKTAIEVKLFGRSGLDMALILGQGKDALKDQLKEGYSSGLMYADLVTKGEDFVDAQLRVNRSIRDVKAVIVAQALPALSDFGNALSEKIIDKLTNTKRAFRDELAEMAMMPAQMRVAELEVSLQAQKEEIKELEGLYQRASDSVVDMTYGSITAHQAMNTAVAGSGDRYKELKAEIELTGQQLESTNKEIETATKIQNFYNEQRGNAGETTDLLTEKEKKFNAMLQATNTELKALRTPVEVFNDRIDELVDRYIEGALTQEQYLKLEAEAVRVRDASINTVVGLTEAQKTYNTMVEDTANELMALRVPQQIFNDRMFELEERLRAGAISWAEFQALAIDAKATLVESEDATKSLTDNFEDLGDTGEDAMRKIWQVGETAMSSLSNSIAKTVTEGTDLLESLSKISMSVLQQFISTMIQMGLDYILAPSGDQAYFGQGAGAQGAPRPQGTRAEGGAVVAGTSYLVGERGAEVFTPNQSGGISNAGGGEVTVQMNINALDSRDVLNVIAEQKGAIVGMVQQEFNKRGMRGFAR